MEEEIEREKVDGEGGDGGSGQDCEWEGKDERREWRENCKVKLCGKGRKAGLEGKLQGLVIWKRKKGGKENGWKWKGRR